jgi:hypothetical protein
VENGLSSLGGAEQRVRVSLPSALTATQPKPSLQIHWWAEQLTDGALAHEAVPVAARTGVVADNT